VEVYRAFLFEGVGIFKKNFSPLEARILEYGSIQTQWICQHTTSSAVPTDGLKVSTVHSRERNDPLFSKALKLVLRASKSDSVTADQLRDLQSDWRLLVGLYSRRALTLGTDRLPAISGIAAQFGNITGDGYKAGLWKSTMEFELLWRIVPE
jgi:hypothetical protein